MTQQLQAPPKRQFRLGFSMWSVPLLAQTDSYEVIVVGLSVGQNGAISYQAVDGRKVPAAGTTLVHLRSEES